MVCLWDALLPPMTVTPAREGARVRTMFAAISSRYDAANHLLSGGLDFFWRKRATRLVRAWNSHRILDLATGSGDLACALSAACPEALVVAADFCPSDVADRSAQRGQIPRGG